MTDSDFEFGPEIHAAFEQWLCEHWPKAESAFALLDLHSPTHHAESAKTLATIVHDLSGTAAVVGHQAIGTLAHALARQGRHTDWLADAPLNRLWHALASVVDSRAAVNRDDLHAALLASVADFLE
jgi:hypothetical protein